MFQASKKPRQSWGHETRIFDVSGGISGGSECSRLIRYLIGVAKNKTVCNPP